MANHPIPAYLGRQLGDQYPSLQETIKNTLTEDTLQQLAKQLTKQFHTTISRQDTLNLLTLHQLTQPILHTLYHQNSQNNITRLLETWDNQLQPLIQENPELADRITQFQNLAEKATTPEARQNLLRDFLENLIKTGYRRQQEKLGVVYTPTQIVDWIEHAVDQLYYQNFGQHIGDRNIRILDPFTGTGTFITRLLTNGIIPPENLPYKFTQDIHSMEIMPISYYLHLLSIENEHTALTGNTQSYTGGQLCDTFTHQCQTKPQVIVSNPPLFRGPA